MAKLTFSKRDVAAGTILEPGLYTAKVVAVAEKAAKDGKSMNHVIEFAIGDKEIPLTKYFSEKYLAAMIPLLRAAGADVDDEGFELDTNQLVGVEIKVSIINTVYNGKQQNDIDAYLPA